MQRLRGSDAFTIYAESSASPFVTLKVAIYRPTRGSEIADTCEIKEFVKAGIAAAGATRAGLRIMRVPYDLHHPVWVADPGFSADDHIHRAVLPAPGDKAQLCDFLSQLMGKPLHPYRPLWEIWLVEGLENGRVAIVFKVHHALADGKTLAALIEEGHLKANAVAALPTEVAGEPIPGKLRLIGGAIIDLVKSYTVEFPHYYRHLKQSRQGSAALGGITEDAVAPFSAPYTVFNRQGGHDRIFHYETFSLAEFKLLAKIFDCTINTLILGVCSEALRRYLLEVDTLPSESLINAMPVGGQGQTDLKTLLNSSIHNNHLALAIVPLYQNIDDFRQRLQAIKRASRAAVDNVRRSNGRRFDNYLDFMPGTFIRLFNASIRRRQANKQSPFANVAISNVPGPRETLYALDGRLEMEELLSTGNLTDGVNLNITVWSYVDKLCFSFYSRKGALPEPEKINGHLRTVVEELRRQYLPDSEPVQSH
jgi:diacylglycerol O-acyltransferase / wax synthase